MPKKSKIKMPGPIWAWIVAAVVFSQVVKRGIIGWPFPKEFNFGSRFMENFVANLLYGLPVLVVFFIAFVIVNIRKNKQILQILFVSFIN